ncbi:hypothetical protein [Streptomyces beihaiensis]|uniref:Uncharacterized protein n=1 Tax=Streptomyces beihaiensis TaxID=2984495 RepID=A0ABT3TSE2_9ACTN|nr:hypothetical protein [Streptomyces beihaiensis]MCX3059958.1 hypothetical protein [Streptomyces beihaiensis]
MGSLLAQGDEITFLAPAIGAGKAAGEGNRDYAWRVSLPQNTGFTAARSTSSGVDLTITGHQVVLGSSRFEG